MLTITCERCGSKLALAVHKEKDERDSGIIAAITVHGALAPAPITDVDSLTRAIENDKESGYEIKLVVEPCEKCLDKAIDDGYDDGERDGKDEAEKEDADDDDD